MELNDLKNKILNTPNSDKLLYSLAYNDTGLSFDEVKRIVSVDEAIKLINDAEILLKTYKEHHETINDYDNYNDEGRYYQISCMGKTSYGGKGVFDIDFFIVKDEEILKGIELLSNPYKTIAKDLITNSKLGKYLTFEDLECDIFEKIINIIEQPCKENDYRLKNHFMNMHDLLELIKDNIIANNIPVEDFKFNIKYEGTELEINHFIFNKPITICQWVEEIKHIDYDFYK